MEKIWNIKTFANEHKIAHLAKVLGITPGLANLLLHRNITSFDEAKVFFRPSLEHLYDPFLMKDMKTAVVRVDEALNKGEKILILGDYDVDGTTAVSLLYKFFHDINVKNIDFYIPDRYAEGYGISYEGIEYAHENNCRLIISVDCGIRAIDKINYAHEKNIDFIICDHHLPGDKLPNASAILDPKQESCPYPYKGLSGCGVAYKLAKAIIKHKNLSSEIAYKYLDLVAVSIASDIVPITGENRILEFFGLKKLNSNPSTGLQAIIKVAGIEDKKIDVTDIVFKIGPRINAAGRLESGKTAVNLLITEDKEYASNISDQINIINNERKDLDKTITEEALDMIAGDEELLKAKSTVLYNDKWHKGVVGIVASRVMEHHYRPTIILTRSNGMATGSARSIASFNLFEAIDACGDLLEKYGGHSHAAGLSLKEENIEKFKNRFEEFVHANTTPEMFIPTLDIDALLSIKEITPKFFRILKQFAPFGPENMKPLFCSKNVIANGSAKLVGNTQEHLKLNIFDADDKSQSISAIAFSQHQHFEEICKGKPFDICYTLEENNFNGNVTIQMNIKDIRFSSEV